jgi:formylglycine-generating enzyme required for sulfatase activity
LYPNGFGLFDMHGNVWEWCQNSARATALDTPEEDAPAPSSDFRVNRGGGWHNPSDHCASSSRGIISPKSRFCYLGLRLARSLDLSQLRTPPDTGTASKINP